MTKPATKGKYHVSPDGVECCQANNGACKYEPKQKSYLINHFDTEQQAQTVFEKAILNYVPSKFGTTKVTA